MKTKWVNSLTSSLKVDAQTPGDPFVHLESLASHIPRQVKGHFSYVSPTPTPEPKLLALNAKYASQLGLNLPLDILFGNKVLEHSNPWALNYGGHQFGSWAGQLGDGRAISIGEFMVDSSRFELQLKGAGMTPYSRFADGYAVLRSSIREYLGQEACHALGIPTSRSLSLVGSSRPVIRETVETGAIVCRVAPSWIRFGCFELPFARNDLEGLKTLVDYTISTHFSHLNPGDGLQGHLYFQWLRDVTHKTAHMIAKWQAFGFCHGVMNTDNFSILGLTIDYGPFQFMDYYESGYVCNHSDELGRYAYDQQPSIALSNLGKLCTVIIPLIAQETQTPADAVTKALIEMLADYKIVLDQVYFSTMALKLGLDPDKQDQVRDIVESLLSVMELGELDYTLVFRTLSETRLGDDMSSELLEKLLKLAGRANDMLPQRLKEWYKTYRGAFSTSESWDLDRMEKMKTVNPRYILRNYVVNQVIEDVKKGNLESLERYSQILEDPFVEGSEQDQERFGQPPPPSSSFRDEKCSCSS